jgi:hypothetical protein
MVCFQTKNPTLGKFWRVLENLSIFYDHLVYFTATGNFLRHFQFWHFLPRKIWQPCGGIFTKDVNAVHTYMYLLFGSLRPTHDTKEGGQGDQSGRAFTVTYLEQFFGTT